MGWRRITCSFSFLATMAESSIRSINLWSQNLENGPSLLYNWTIASAGIFVLVALVLSMYLLFEHLAAYNQPEEQKFLIGLILMVPVYALESYLSPVLLGHGKIWLIPVSTRHDTDPGTEYGPDPAVCTRVRQSGEGNGRKWREMSRNGRNPRAGAAAPVLKKIIRKKKAMPDDSMGLFSFGLIWVSLELEIERRWVVLYTFGLFLSLGFFFSDSTNKLYFFLNEYK